MSKRALLVIDIQNDYFEGGKYGLFQSEAASLKAKDLLEFYRVQGETIVHIKHINTGLIAPFFAKNTRGADIHTSVIPQESEKVITKNKVDSFCGTDLAEFLNSKGVSELVICGMQTNVCVQTAALGALKRGYKVTVVQDAAAARTPELHENALDLLRLKQVELLTMQSVMGNSGLENVAAG